ncbi:hypothetical protein [Pseudoprimorskyibacter insulae]|uniref:Uncharacterized protein n=1 Tax=Pseudoprimorskyibacter insulae TaxID=1695997 RepID=A0A2R8AYG6_9RHOB|nr:hypothetical protein [Pseudoprimorskyibacter insulae]SPF81050.1 hypothetical protein PRI8871_02867 [Pseudoprimorskyibacter insulae]
MRIDRTAFMHLGPYIYAVMGGALVLLFSYVLRGQTDLIWQRVGFAVALGLMAQDVLQPAQHMALTGRRFGRSIYAFHQGLHFSTLFLLLTWDPETSMDAIGYSLILLTLIFGGSMALLLRRNKKAPAFVVEIEKLFDTSPENASARYAWVWPLIVIALLAWQIIRGPVPPVSLMFSLVFLQTLAQYYLRKSSAPWLLRYLHSFIGTALLITLFIAGQ